MQEARNHHFVPKLLLRPWLKEEPERQFNLWGYYWDQRRQQLACKRRGLDGFCCQIDLLTLKRSKLKRDAIERVFFGDIDTKGAEARDILLQNGPETLSKEQRVHFARLLLSLESRRPAIVKKLRIEGAQFIARELDQDPEVLAAFAHEGIFEKPSAFFERTKNTSLEDKALCLVQGITDSEKVGSQLINAGWDVIRLGRTDGSFILSDRPLIRVDAFDSPGAVWTLPLTPKAAFIAANHPENLKRVQSISKFQQCRNINISSALQAERFVFSIDPQHAKWLGRYLGPHKGK